MISCDEAAIICNKAQYNEATFFEKMKLKLHVFICGPCASFTKKNTAFSTLCEKASLQGLSEKEKLKMKKKLEQHQ